VQHGGLGKRASFIRKEVERRSRQSGPLSFVAEPVGRMLGGTAAK